MQIQKQSANQVWKALKKSGSTTLDFVPWLEREKRKGFKNFAGEVSVPINTALNEAVQQALVPDDKPALATKKYILGAPKIVWIGIGAGILIVVGVIVYKKMKG